MRDYMLEGIPLVITGKSNHVIEPTVFEREDGMAMQRQVNGTWVIRAPIKGPTRFWDGSEWALVTSIEIHRGIWPLRFQFEGPHARYLLEMLEAP